MTIRTTSPKYYITPDESEIKSLCHLTKLINHKYDLVEDLCNLEAGGEIVNSAELQSKVTDKVELNTVKKGNLFSFEQDTDESRINLIKKCSNRILDEELSKIDFLRTLDRENLPGDSPLQRSISAMKLLEVLGGEDAYLSMRGKKGLEFASVINKTTEKCKSLTKDDIAIIDPGGELDDAKRDKTQDGTRQPHDRFLRSLKIAENLICDKTKLILETCAKVDKISTLTTHKYTKEKEDSDGDKARYRAIKDISELGALNVTSWASYLETPAVFWQDVSSGNLDVRETTSCKELRQILYIASDASGSMEGTRHFKASGIIMNRLKAVLRDEAEVWLGLFDYKLTHLGKASTREEALKLITLYRNKNFSGGSTNIAQAILDSNKIIIAEMEKNPLLCKPELLVITDDDTSVSEQLADSIGGLTVHGFAINASNYGLRRLAESTGGVYVENL